MELFCKDSFLNQVKIRYIFDLFQIEIINLESIFVATLNVAP